MRKHNKKMSESNEFSSEKDPLMISVTPHRALEAGKDIHLEDTLLQDSPTVTFYTEHDRKIWEQIKAEILQFIIHLKALNTELTKQANESLNFSHDIE